MLKTLKRWLDAAHADGAMPAAAGHAVQAAVATLLHESARVDLDTHPAELAAAEQALAGLFGLTPAECSALLHETQARAGQLTTYFPQVSMIKREFLPEQRVALVEQLWRVAFAHGLLDPYEDHFVRKIAHLLHVSNTQVMLARQRARGTAQ